MHRGLGELCFVVDVCLFSLLARSFAHIGCLDAINPCSTVVFENVRDAKHAAKELQDKMLRGCKVVIRTVRVPNSRHHKYGKTPDRLKCLLFAATHDAE